MSVIFSDKGATRRENQENNHKACVPEGLCVNVACYGRAGSKGSAEYCCLPLGDKDNQFCYCNVP